MLIRSVRHSGLRRFIADDDASGLPANFVEKIRNILSFLQDMNSLDELKRMPMWRVHPLTGDRKGSWSLTVTRNWRITFRVVKGLNGNEIADLDYADYH
jgi:proteic killer suppression protein